MDAWTVDELIRTTEFVYVALQYRAESSTATCGYSTESRAHPHEQEHVARPVERRLYPL